MHSFTIKRKSSPYRGFPRFVLGTTGFQPQRSFLYGFAFETDDRVTGMISDRLGEEDALIADLAEKISSYPGISTFYGKKFHLPYLREKGLDLYSVFTPGQFEDLYDDVHLFQQTLHLPGCNKHTIAKTLGLPAPPAVGDREGKIFEQFLMEKSRKDRHTLIRRFSEDLRFLSALKTFLSPYSRKLRLQDDPMFKVCSIRRKKDLLEIGLDSTYQEELTLYFPDFSITGKNGNFLLSLPLAHAPYHEDTTVYYIPAPSERIGKPSIPFPQRIWPIAMEKELLYRDILHILPCFLTQVTF